MNETFSLMDLESGHLAGVFRSVEDAVDALRVIVAQRGADAVCGYALERFVDGHGSLVAMDDELAALLTRTRTDRIAAAS